MGLVPYVALGLLILFVRRRFPERDGVATAAVAWAAFLTLLTELTSAFSVLAFGPLLFAWASCVATAGVLLVRTVKAPATGAVRPLPGWNPEAVAVSVLVGLVGVAALASAPNNFDAMVYHMSRVAHWVQDRSVAPYPTHELRQLHHPPWSEWAVAHLQVLGGSDRFANTPQWLALMGAASLAGAVAAQMGGESRARRFAALFVVTIPIAVIEASTPKNDVVAAFWLLCFVHFLLRIRNGGPGSGRSDATLAGGALGLALLTKGTSYLFAPPFVWLAAPWRWRSPWRTATVALATALLLNVGHYGRNLEVFGHPLGPRSEGLLNYANDAITPPLLVSNLLRNVSLQLDTRTPVLNRGIVATVRRAHDMVGLDPNDPRTTWSNLVFDGPRPSTDADTAGNLWHFLLTVLVVLLVAFAPPLPVHRAYSWALMAAFLLFCAYLRWQPWHTRLHLPLFVLAAPLVSVLLCSRLPPRGSGAVGALLVLWALPLVLMNPTSPLLGPRSVFRVARQAQYFRNWPDLESPYRRAVRTVTAANCTDVGLYEDVRWEYPLWPLFRAQASHVRIEHVGVTNASGSLAQREPFRSFSPCAVISFQPNAATSLRLGQLVYDRASSGAGVTVFLSSGRERK